MSQNPTGRLDLAQARRILAGDRDAFEHFFERHFDAVYRFALGRLCDEGAARDVVQTTFCIAIEKLGSYRGEASLLTWLCSICRHETMAHSRQNQRETPVGLIEDSPELQAVLETLGGAGSAEEVTLREEAARLVHLTLDHLPAHYARALELKYFEGLSVAEIGRRLDLGPKAAESTLTRARQAFSRVFKTASRDLASLAGAV